MPGELAQDAGLTADQDISSCFEQCLRSTAARNNDTIYSTTRSEHEIWVLIGFGKSCQM